MNVIKHEMQSWEIKYGQILISVKDYEQAIRLFGKYLDKTFDIETPYGIFRNKKFLHYEKKKTIRLACKPFFEKLKERDTILLQPLGENSIKIIIKGIAEPTKPPIIKLPLIEKLRETQHNSKNPAFFEKAVVDAFNSLGFSAKHLGGRDEPDILIEDLNIILDTKTTKEGVITERYINFDAIERYKDKYNAKYIGIVAPGFSEGHVRNTAKKKGIVLIETEAICTLLQNHAIYPFDTNQIVEILFKSGKDIITTKDVPPSTIDQEKLIEIVAKILSDIKLTRKNSFSSKELHIAYSWQGLNYKFDEIEHALKFLSVAPFSIFKKHNDEYSLTQDIDAILKKIGLLLQAFNKIGGTI